MNVVGIALVWCAVQVTLAGVLVDGVYLILRRFQPAAGKSIASTGLLITIALSAMALSPWPRWSLRGRAWETASVVPNEGVTWSPPEGQLRRAQADESPRASAAAGEGAAEPGASSAVLFFQTMADELTGTPARPAGTTWRWSAVVAVLFLIAAGAGTAWLVVGLLAVRACGTEPAHRREGTSGAGQPPSCRAGMRSPN